MVQARSFRSGPIRSRRGDLGRLGALDRCGARVPGLAWLLRSPRAGSGRASGRQSLARDDPPLCRRRLERVHHDAHRLGVNSPQGSRSTGRGTSVVVRGALPAGRTRRFHGDPAVGATGRDRALAGRPYDLGAAVVLVTAARAIVSDAGRVGTARLRCGGGHRTLGANRARRLDQQQLRRGRLSRSAQVSGRLVAIAGLSRRVRIVAGLGDRLRRRCVAPQPLASPCI